VSLHLLFLDVSRVDARPTLRAGGDAMMRELIALGMVVRSSLPSALPHCRSSTLPSKHRQVLSRLPMAFADLSICTAQELEGGRCAARRCPFAAGYLPSAQICYATCCFTSIPMRVPCSRDWLAQELEEGDGPPRGEAVSFGAAMCCLRGRAFEAQDNGARAAACFAAALRADPFCYEAFQVRTLPEFGSSVCMVGPVSGQWKGMFALPEGRALPRASAQHAPSCKDILQVPKRCQKAAFFRQPLLGCRR